MGIFGKLKRPVVEEPKKPVYRYNQEAGTYIISCPYCNRDLREVYYKKVDEVVIGSCRYCNKSLKV